MTDQQKNDLDEMSDRYDPDTKMWDDIPDSKCLEYVNRPVWDRMNLKYFVYAIIIAVIIICGYVAIMAWTGNVAPEIVTESDVNHLQYNKIGARVSKFWVFDYKTFGKRHAHPIEREAIPSGWYPISEPVSMRISCYDRTGNPTASGLWIDEALEMANELLCDGICAVSPDSRYYANRKVQPFQTVYVEGHGVFMVVDCTARRITNTIDIFVDGCNWNEGLQFLDYEDVWEVAR